ncbi:MAG: UDP-glucose 4-epimerase GalE [Pyrinomonadaceae bacterium]
MDNLVYGHNQAVFEDTPFYEGNIGDADLVKRITDEHNIEACVHFAAYAYVGESVEKPGLYYENNVAQGLHLLDALIAANVKRVVFSSTCATYGEPQRLPIDETHPQQPTSPYGASKLFMERIMRDYDHAHGLRFVALRYFNAAGATDERGEDHGPEPHLIPLVLHAAQGKRAHISVFGNDYQTPDGTCVRDYIHVADLASAHLAALDYLQQGGESTAINLGNGQGYSVLEVIETAREVTGKKIEVKFEPRRAGDPSHLVADATKAREVLGWQPQQASLKEIISTAWKWHEAHPNGYKPVLS